MNFPPEKLYNILDHMDMLQTTPGEVLVALLHNQNYSDAGAIESVIENLSAILDGLMQHARTPETTVTWARHFMQGIYTSEILRLTDKSAGLHFVAVKTSEKRLWTLLDTLLSASPRLNYIRGWRQRNLKKQKRAQTGDGGGNQDVEMGEATSAEQEEYLPEHSHAKYESFVQHLAESHGDFPPLVRGS